MSSKKTVHSHVAVVLSLCLFTSQVGMAQTPAAASVQPSAQERAPASQELTENMSDAESFAYQAYQTVFSKSLTFDTESFIRRMVGLDGDELTTVLSAIRKNLNSIQFNEQFYKANNIPKEWQYSYRQILHKKLVSLGLSLDRVASQADAHQAGLGRTIGLTVGAVLGVILYIAGGMMLKESVSTTNRFGDGEKFLAFVMGTAVGPFGGTAAIMGTALLGQSIEKFVKKFLRDVKSSDARSIKDIQRILQKRINELREANEALDSLS